MPPKVTLAISMLLLALVAMGSPARAAGASPAPAATAAPAHSARPLTTVDVALAAHDDLRDLTFWIAVGAGYFTDAGIEVHPSYPAAPGELLPFMRLTRPSLAVLPGPVYLRLIAEKYPLVVVANLLASDPMDLVVRTEAAKRHRLDPTLPLNLRLRQLRGLRVAVAPDARSRLRALFGSVGLSADRWVKIVERKEQELNEALRAGRVDALYVDTPYLERALIDDHALLMVNQSSDAIPVLAQRPAHALVARTDFAADHSNLVRRVTRALYRAEVLVHGDPAAATAALLRAIPGQDSRLVAKVVELYGPAVPENPRVSVDTLRRELAHYPASEKAPDLRDIDLTRYVAPQFAELAQIEESPPASAKVKPGTALVRALMVALVLAVALGILVRRARKHPPPASASSDVPRSRSS